MDFVIELPFTLDNYNAILIIINQFTKKRHLILYFSGDGGINAKVTT